MYDVVFTWNEISLCVKTDSYDVCHALTVIFHNLVSDTPDNDCVVVSCEKDTYLWVVNGNNFKVKEFSLAINILVSEIINYFVINSKNLCFLHGGAIINKFGDVSIFLGQSKSGKSSLISKLICNYEYDFLCDEVLAIDLKGKRVVPFQRSLSLRRETIDFLGIDKHSLYSLKTIDDEIVHYVIPTMLSQNKFFNEQKIKNIIFPAFSKFNNIEFCKKLDAFKKIITNSVNLISSTNKHIDELIEMVKNAKCYNIQFDSIKKGVEEFLSIDEGE